MYSSKIDVPVLLIFFNRPGCFEQVFEQVKKARPNKLFLYQDGARGGNEKDKIGIAKCRAIAEDIDWECEVHRLYQEKNVGCDPSGYNARKWVFEYVDRCIVLEDDCVPSQSFFPFCKELLEKYKDDQRIEMICGMNNLEYFDSPYSYIFSITGSVCGVATWKRVLDMADESYSFLEPGYNLEKLTDTLEIRGINTRSKLDTWYFDKCSGVVHHEAVLGAGQLLNHRLNIVTTVNMIHNIGNTPEGGTHSTSGVETIPKGLRRIFTMEAHDIDFPIKHPQYVIEDIQFQRQLDRVMGNGHPMVQLFRKIEKTFLIFRHEGIRAAVQKVKSAIHR